MPQIIRFSVFAILAFLGSELSAQLNPIKINIPMRDGKTLAGDLYAKDTTSKRGTILIMTPYGKFYYKLRGLPFGIKFDINKSKYDIVIVDWRGRFESSSAFVAGSKNGEDGYDVVQWIAAQGWSDGKIGTWGPSALGNVQMEIAKNQPPNLVCCVPEVCSPILEYRKYHPGGVMEAASFKTLNEKLFPGSYNLVIQNPHDNNVWQFVENNSTYPDKITVPVFLIAGWFDHNIDQDLVLLDMFAKSSAMAVRDKHKILIGPWVHGGTGQASLGTTFQGDLSFPKAEKWNDSLSMRFFDYYLGGVSNGWDKQNKYLYYHMGEHKWVETSSWPPKSQNLKYLLKKNGSLSNSMEVADEKLSYSYDPTDPSPSVGGKTLSDDLDQGPYDQAPKVESRNDVLLFTTDALANDLDVKGKIKVKLNVSSDRIDTDFAVRLTEVYPNGKSIMLLEGIQRMRFRNGYKVSDTAFMKPGTVYPIEIELDDISNRFLKGNKIRLIVSSSNYPMYNRNMNTGDEMYPGDNVDSVHNPLIAINNVHMGPSYSSSVEFPVVDASMNRVSYKKSSIEVYPNPSNGEFYIRGMKNDVAFQIYDLQHRLIKEFRGNYFSVSKPGVYILIAEGVHSVVRKIVVN